MTPLEDYIDEAIKMLFRPRLMCICRDFRWTGYCEMDWAKCECGGWMSRKEMAIRGESLGAHIDNSQRK